MLKKLYWTGTTNTVTLDQRVFSGAKVGGNNTEWRMAHSVSAS